ncbi:transglutaminase family protein [Granulibacter bethesdensis]|uniref:Transglutaminase-like protein n=1 Tax=Granulibacter bethesdensis TaxID=364410 RepID=A0AAN0RCD2_9PROT|nr:transglutaminase family protein [Granulibacter bethesdensis]AHJ62256.1 Transglutaminase-like protein [Granulibacter bethesdensis]AHJ64884.1 Transglutaminase-like protein [Granulibacter bethesdensis CGDNIH4]AHJ67504.1 Transglutaminase-like protein [Granulibacter bethesdensis]APH58796.1 Transglutaminase-like protein [Granulibacter bethesdensis]
MPRVLITHITTYRYHQPVSLGRHRLMMRPRDSHDLRMNDATLTFYPPPVETRWAHDVFGNSVCYVQPDPAESDRFEITSRLDLDHFPSNEDLPIDPVARTYPFGYAAEELPDIARLQERHHPDPDHRLELWARKFVRKGRATGTMRLLMDMTRAIQRDFTYEARDTQGTRAPLKTLDLGRGACRDFALLMMEAVRSLGFAARFVSGYLYDPDIKGPAMVGGATTHAWCAVYLPGAGWVEFDPTNGLIAGRNLIRICVARTPSQAVPIAGSYMGHSGDFATLSVDVQIKTETA